MMFWDELPRPFFALAPMEAVTDVVFRHVIARAGAPDIYFTEFTNATGWVHAGDRAIRGRLLKTDDEHPIVAQIWGGEPGDMEQIAHHCHELGYDGIDINMGCPVKSAVKSGGAALIRQPDLAVAAITAAKSAGLPVSVKTRLGYTHSDEWRDWLSVLLSQDIAALTIHLRTKREMSKVPAHWDIMPGIVQLRDQIAPHTLIIGNGDVRNRAHGLELIGQYGCDGAMIGRGVFAEPFVFAKEGGGRMKDEAERQSNQSEVRRAVLLDLLAYHLDLYDEYAAQTGRPFDTLKRFFKVYIRDFDGASDLRTRLMSCADTDEVRRALTLSQS